MRLEGVFASSCLLLERRRSMAERSGRPTCGLCLSSLPNSAKLQRPVWNPGSLCRLKRRRPQLSQSQVLTWLEIRLLNLRSSRGTTVLVCLMNCLERPMLVDAASGVVLGNCWNWKDRGTCLSNCLGARGADSCALTKIRRYSWADPCAPKKGEKRSKMMSQQGAQLLGRSRLHC